MVKSGQVQSRRAKSSQVKSGQAGQVKLSQASLTSKRSSLERPYSSRSATHAAAPSAPSSLSGFVSTVFKKCRYDSRTAWPNKKKKNKNAKKKKKEQKEARAEREGLEQPEGAAIIYGGERGRGPPAGATAEVPGWLLGSEKQKVELHLCSCNAPQALISLQAHAHVQPGPIDKTHGLKLQTLQQ